MDQKIKIRIAGKEYLMNAPTAEIEELIRLAAAKVNKEVSAYVAKYPGKEMVDILSFVALNEAIGGISRERKLTDAESEAAALARETENYIENIGD